MSADIGAKKRLPELCHQLGRSYWTAVTYRPPTATTREPVAPPDVPRPTESNTALWSASESASATTPRDQAGFLHKTKMTQTAQKWELFSTGKKSLDFKSLWNWQCCSDFFVKPLDKMRSERG